MKTSELTKSQTLCHACIEEPHLSSIVETEGVVQTCSYCYSIEKSLSISDISDKVELAIRQHYRRTPEHPSPFEYAMHSDKELGYDWEREGLTTAYLIEEIAQIPEKAATDIQEILFERNSDIDMLRMSEECEFDEDAHYEEVGPDDAEWKEEWLEFESSLKYETRYFNRTGLRHLSEIFSDIESLFDHQGNPLIVTIGPKSEISHLFRARAFQSHEKLTEAMKRPDIHMSNPPPKLSRAGRMNAHGISTFYAATDEPTAIAEVRPPVGSQVLVAKFSVLRNLRLLDLNALDSATLSGSVFDENWATKLERLSFLRTLSQIMTRPVMPDDEALDYLPTQAIADFLSTESSLRLDGILFPSIQTEAEGVNLVLFQASARVNLTEPPKGSTIDALTSTTTEDGMEPDYRVIETFTKSSENEVTRSQKSNSGAGLFDFSEHEHSSQMSQPTLDVDKSNMSVHVIKRVHYGCQRHDVEYSRSQRAEIDF